MSDSGLVERLVNHYGTTTNFRLGGFILPDGLFLDFSDGTAARALDHRNVAWALPDGAPDLSRYDAMALVAKRAAMIRFSPEAWVGELWTPPTETQQKVIQRLAAHRSLMVEAVDGDSTFCAYYPTSESDLVAPDLADFFSGRKRRVRRNAAAASRRGRLRVVVLLPPSDFQKNGRANWGDYVKGEWWLDSSGRSTFADQDIGEAGHEQVAIDSMVDAEALMSGLVEWYRSGSALSEGWIRDDAHNKADDLEAAWGRGTSAAELLAVEYIPDEVGAAAAGSPERWRDVQEDPRTAYAKHEGAILAIDTAFATWKVTDSTIAAIQAFIYDVAADEDEDIDDADTEVIIEQLGPPKKWGSMPIKDFMLITKPKEIFRK